MLHPRNYRKIEFVISPFFTEGGAHHGFGATMTIVKSQFNSRPLVQEIALANGDTELEAIENAFLVVKKLHQAGKI